MKLRHLYIDNVGCMTCLQKLKFLIFKKIWLLGEREIQTLDIFVGNTRKCQSIKLQDSWQLYVSIQQLFEYIYIYIYIIFKHDHIFIVYKPISKYLARTMILVSNSFSWCENTTISQKIILHSC